MRHKLSKYRVDNIEAVNEEYYVEGGTVFERAKVMLNMANGDTETRYFSRDEDAIQFTRYITEKIDGDFFSL